MNFDQLEKWQKWSVGKPCPKHPQSLIKDGKWGNWCGNKTDLGTWCDGGFPSDDDLTRMKNYEKNSINKK